MTRGAALAVSSARNVHGEVPLFESADVVVLSRRSSAGSRLLPSSPIDPCVAVEFPRGAAWILAPGGTAFVADRNRAIVTLEDSEQRLDPLGEGAYGSDLVIVSPSLLESGASARGRLDGAAGLRSGTISAALYLRQRRLVRSLLRDRPMRPEVEREAAAIVGATLDELALDAARLARSSAAGGARRSLAERARAALAVENGVSTRLADLALALGVSPFHLCRVFREATGMTLRAFRLELRLRRALERFSESRADLGALAIELGFSSHSHFTAAFRRSFGVAPSQLRRPLAV